MEPRVIFEDREILVLDKPSGMIVNKSDTTVGEKTVQDWVQKYLKIPNSKSHPFENLRMILSKSKDQIPNKFKITNSNVENGFEFRDPKLEFRNRAGIVHRLDKETSGILLVAKNPEAFENLQKQFKERKVKKTYTALAHGKVEPAEGEINVPVGRLPWNRKRFGVMAEGRNAITRYRVISNFIHSTGSGQISNSQEALTLLELYPKTGRTHQIRVHLKYINHAIFSDPLYAGRKTGRQDRKYLPRIFLHASKISFNHAKTGESVSFESPLPDQLKDFLVALNN